MKRFGYEHGADYPDYGCNTEAYTAGSIIEVESLGPLRTIAPGESIKHLEHWQLLGGVDGEAVELQLLGKTRKS